MTDWDNLEGVALDVALVRVARRPVRRRALFEGVLTYHESLDLLMEDIMPRGKDIGWLYDSRENTARFWLAGVGNWRAHGDTIPLALARVLGKALEACGD